MESNYEKQVYRAREIFLKYDQDVLIRKFQLEHDENYLYIEMLGNDYRIVRETGEIEEWPGAGSDRQLQEVQKQDTGKGLADQEIHNTLYTTCLDYQVVMTIYDILCYSKETPQLSGEWCSLQSLQVTMSSPSPDKLHRECARGFFGQADKLQRACQRLGGERLAVPASADVCYKIHIFPFFPVIFQFWDGDDEFDPKIMLLWDRKSLDFMHFETVYYAMNHLLKTLCEMVDAL